MRHVIVIFIALLLMSCATDSMTVTQQTGRKFKVVDLYPKFKVHMSSCTETHGFDPSTATVDEHALAPGEKPWRECVYQGIEEYIVAYSLVPQLYKQIVAEDRAMTDQIAQGTLTRSARRARLDALIGEIRSAEINERDILVNQANELQDFIKRQQELDEIIRMHRQASELSRLLGVIRLP